MVFLKIDFCVFKPPPATLNFTNSGQKIIFQKIKIRIQPKSALIATANNKKLKIVLDFFK
ncbi:MAG: hypothetical protein A2X34_01975 [Elusimicrobia bacterium GWC2_51_8]|nr:MAG: hypothetical protein A2X34_01975 [Elusimicrobia bacterium GWC2_51_8]HAF95541.1 hypothetical protein [Elusimicrobiota bacterium]HCE98371.1 hypothetical protein [Elusimicrobiota bacterium]